MRPMLAALVLICCGSCAEPRRPPPMPPPALPPLPGACRTQRQGGVALGDPLPQAALRLAADRRALNAQVAACAAWYDALRAAGP